MSKSIGFSGALAVGVVSALVSGCGSSSSGGGGGGGSTANLSALRAEYAAPTASLQAGDVSTVAKSLSQDESQTTGVPVQASSTSIHARAMASGRLRPMDTPISCTAATSSGVTCTCNGGGSLTETVVEGGQTGDVQGTIDYDACVVDDSTDSTTESINGTMTYADYTTSPAMFIYAGSLQETTTPPGTTVSVDFNFALINGEATYSVKVSDGTLLVSESGSWDAATDSGTFTVTDKNGTWTCTLTNGSGTCTGPSGTINV